MKQTRDHRTRASFGMTRREFVKAGAVGMTSLMAGAALGARAPAIRTGKRSNILLMMTDQQGLGTISALGCKELHTPNLDRLVRRGVSFMQSHSADPVCSPARASMITGRMPSETGVVRNVIPIRAEVPNIGQWFGQEGYETIWAGKCDLPEPNPATMPGFTVLPAGVASQGNLGDSAISRACEGYLRNRVGNAPPFLMVASLFQPHDICSWHARHMSPDGWEAPPKIAGKFPKLPPNFNYDPREPKAMSVRRPNWSEEQWRYYLWAYYRHVEMADAEIGRILDALEDSGEAENTVIVFTSDHGEGRACHHMIGKNYAYDEAVKVPLLVSYPGRIPEKKQDLAHLVSGIDITPTICDFLGIKTPPDVTGRSLRPLLEGKTTEWREFVAAEVKIIGRMIRTPTYKYVTYKGDPVEQLFDMQADPGETKNLAGDGKHDSVLEDHRKLLKEWESHLKVAPPSAAVWEHWPLPFGVVALSY